MSTHQPNQPAPQPQPALQPDTPTSALLGAAQRERLSALADGERGGSGLSQADELAAALADWRDDAEARQAWHSYQLIGDVLRSDDLARPARDDLAFMSRLRERLETEPLHLAPAPAPAVAAPAARPFASRRKLGAALAASCAVATVALLLARDAGTGAGADHAPALAAAGSALPDTARAGGVVAAGAAGTPLAVNAQGVLRDPRLDEFLRLHHMARGGLAVGAPGGTLQRADLQMPGGADR